MTLIIIIDQYQIYRRNQSMNRNRKNIKIILIKCLNFEEKFVFIVVITTIDHIIIIHAFFYFSMLVEKKPKFNKFDI